MSSGLGIRPSAIKTWHIQEWTRCVWCAHNFSAHNSLLHCCIRGCDCKRMELAGDLLDQHTMEVCV